MLIIADIFLAAGAMGAAFYCYVLSARLKRFTDLEKGVGGAVAVLSAQVDDLTRALVRAQASAATAGDALATQSTRAEAAADRIELLVASLHDLPEPEAKQPPSSPFFVRQPPQREVA